MERRTRTRRTSPATRKAPTRGRVSALEAAIAAGAAAVEPSLTIRLPEDFAVRQIVDDSAVHHPKHYTSSPSGIECIQVIRHMNFNRGTVIRYVWRAGDKDPRREIEDLEKARWYLNDEIARLRTKAGL